MTLANLLRETLDVDCDEVWENERTPTLDSVFGVRLDSMGLSMREVVAVLETLGIDRSHGAVWNWTHDLAEAQDDPPTAEPSRVAVDEKQIEVEITAGGRYLQPRDDPAAAFLYRVTEKHDVSETEFLVDGGGYLTDLFHHELSGQLGYNERNHIEKWFQTVPMWIDRFHSF